MIEPPLRILLVEENGADARRIEQLLREGLVDGPPALEMVRSTAQGFARARAGRYDILLLGATLDGADGIAFLKDLRGRGDGTPLLLLADLGHERAAVEAMRAGAADYLVKDDLDAAALALAVRQAMGKRTAGSDAEARGGQQAAEDVLAWMETLLRTAPVGLAFLDRDLRYVRVNEAMAAFKGIAPLAHLGHSVRELIPHLAPRLEPIIRSVLQSGNPAVNVEVKEEPAAEPGRTRHWLCSYYPVRGMGGATVGVGAVVVDITERKRAEEVVRASEENHRRLVELCPDAVFVHAEGRILLMNPAGARMFGAGHPAEVVGTSVLDLVHPDFRTIVQERIRAAVAGRATPLIEEKLLRRDRTEVEVEVSAAPCTYDNRPAVQVIARDITERKRVERELRASEGRKAAVLEGALDCIIGIDHQGRVLEFNPAAERIFGYRRAEALGRELAELIVPPSQREAHRHGLQRYLAGGEGKVLGRRIEMTAVRADGNEFPVEMAITRLPSDGPPVFTGFLRDLTERNALEQRLRHSQKMEGVGRLAAGIAHDFNNLLTAILGYGDLLLRDLGEADPRHPSLREIRKAAQRAASLTSQLLAFSRQQVLQPRVLEINEVVVGMEAMLRRLIGEDIDLRTTLPPGLGRVKADPGQLEQVIMNLVVNARDAMPRGGRLTLETADVDLDAAYVLEHDVVKPGPYVMLALSDTGVGMNKETRALIFEPFFTTKEVGRGTGLGLATVYGIVKQSGGYIWVYSEPGLGTTFKIYLPRVPGDAERPEAQGAPSESVRGTETVLLVEDEEMVRALAREILETYGYTVLAAARSEEALRLSELHPGPIHLTLTDVVMPGGSGKDVAQRLALSRPDMKVVYMSGYAGDAIVHHGALEAGTAFVQKPFTPQALARKVREVLDT